MEKNGRQNRILAIVMIRFTATMKKFGKQGEKTGWTYILIPQELSEKLVPGNRKGYRVKGKIDDCPFSMIGIIPMGGGDFILTVNASLRKALRKQHGASVKVEMTVDKGELEPPPAFLECLQDEPEAYEKFNALTKSHRNYYTNWLRSAKTDATLAKRIAAALDALSKGWDFGQMMRSMKKNG